MKQADPMEAGLRSQPAPHVVLCAKTADAKEPLASFATAANYAQNRNSR